VTVALYSGEAFDPAAMPGYGCSIFINVTKDDSMDVQLRGFACLDVAGCFLSLGLLPIILFLQINSLPKRLTDEALITRSGKSIPWNQFTKATITHHYVKGSASSKGSYTGTRFNLTYPGGKLNFYTMRVANNNEVVQFITSHLPANIITT
jgi:hypothetical protein